MTPTRRSTEDGQRQQQQQSLPATPTKTPWPWIKCIRDMTDPTLFADSHQHEHQPVTNKVMGQEVELPIQILPWLYWSDLRNTKTTSKLKENKITHILSLMSKMTPRENTDFQERLEGTGIIHKHIVCNDKEGYDMIGKHWDNCLEFLQQVKQRQHGRVIVHCYAGVNRSGLIVCAAYVILEQRFVIEVVQDCWNKRQSRTFLWNKSFQRQLCELAQQHNLLGPQPEGYDDWSAPPTEQPQQLQRITRSKLAAKKQDQKIKLYNNNNNDDDRKNEYIVPI